MKFLVISPVIHKHDANGYAGYTPYIKEINLWLKHAAEVTVMAPVTNGTPDPLEDYYKHNNLTFVKLPAFDLTSPASAIKAIFKIPLVFALMVRQMREATHIHLRCPSNMGLIGCLCQILFPGKAKTIKYANNWDPSSDQPFSYRLQKFILRNQVLTRNARVLVYGNWNEKSRNIIPFYTASYSANNKHASPPRDIAAGNTVNLLFVGTLTANKRPLLVVEVAKRLINEGYKVQLDILGDGLQYREVDSFIDQHLLSSSVKLRGKVHPLEAVKYFSSAHFLLSLSTSEGWPKVVAESMWWGCLPVATAVSCVGQMLGNGNRGIIVEPDAAIVSAAIINLVNNPSTYNQMCNNAMNWSRQFHLEKFEADIASLVNLKMPYEGTFAY